MLFLIVYCILQLVHANITELNDKTISIYEQVRFSKINYLINWANFYLF